MAYNPNYYYPMGYQPMQMAPQMNTQALQQMSNNMQGRNSVNWVQGEAGANAFPVVAGDSVLMMDIESPTAYMKTVEPNGKPLPLKIYDLVERTHKTTPISAPEPKNEYVTKEEFETFKERIMANIRGVRKPELKKEDDDE